MPVCAADLMRFVNLFLGQLVVRHGIEPFDASRNIAVRNALNFQFMHANKVGNRLKLIVVLSTNQTAVAFAIIGFAISSAPYA